MVEHQVEKRRAACDECRTRKLKCSGEYPQCTRCQRENIQCVYSPQKQMGRPKKRRRKGGTPPELRPDNSHDSVSRIFGATDFASELRQQPNYTNFGGFEELHGTERRQEMEAAANSFDRNVLLRTSPDSWGVGLQEGQEDGVCSFSAISQDQYLNLTDTHIPRTAPQYGVDLGPAIDPLLWDTQEPLPTPNPAIPPDIDSPAVPCICLSTMYLALSDLQTMTSFAFPAAIPAQRKAMTAASTIIHCSRCPKDIFTLIQNTQSLSALLTAIAERFHRILKQIDTEAANLELTGAKKPFRLGDNSPELQHLHTGTPDCPMGFMIELEAKDWRVLAKKVVRSEVLGGGSNPMPLVRLLDQFEERQNEWHSSDHQLEERTQVFGEANTCRPGDAHCVRMINQVRAMVRNMQWE